jgi:hypothetical protein
VCVDHRGPDVRMAQERLDRAKVVTCLKQVRGIRVAEGMGRDALRKLRLSDRFAESLLHARIMHMIAPRFFRLSNEGQRLLRYERKLWTPASHRFKDDTQVPVRIGYGEKALREKAKSAQGKWDPEAKAWYIEYGKIKGTELEKHIILEIKVSKSSL